MQPKPTPYRNLSTNLITKVSVSLKRYRNRQRSSKNVRCKLAQMIQIERAFSTEHTKLNSQSWWNVLAARTNVQMTDARKRGCTGNQCVGALTWYNTLLHHWKHHSRCSQPMSLFWQPDLSMLLICPVTACSPFFDLHNTRCTVWKWALPRTRTFIVWHFQSTKQSDQHTRVFWSTNNVAITVSWEASFCLFQMHWLWLIMSSASQVCRKWGQAVIYLTGLYASIWTMIQFPQASWLCFVCKWWLESNRCSEAGQ